MAVRKKRRPLSIAAELRKAAKQGDQRKQELLTLALEIDADIKIARRLKTLPAQSIRALTDTRDDLLADAGLRRRRNPKPPAPRAGITRAQKRTRYRARVAVPGRRPIVKEFRAVSDRAALGYANGLMLRSLPKGARPVSLKPIDAPARAAAKKKTR